MLEKGRKRQERPVAVVYFVIGLIVLLGILAILYFALFEVDYSDQIRDPETTMRAYVETTPVPEDYVDPSEAEVTPVPEMLTQPEPTEYVYEYDYDEEGDALTEAFNQASADSLEQTSIEDGEATIPEATDVPADGGLPELTDTALTEQADSGLPELTEQAETGWTEPETPAEDESVLVTPEPTPLALETPVPTEEAPANEGAADLLAGLDVPMQSSATPVPTELIAKGKSSGFTVPASASDTSGRIGITECEISEADNGSVMHIVGYGYRDVAEFDGTRCKSYLVVTQRSSGKMKAYQLNIKSGASGLTHEGAKCQNAAASDFDIYISVRDYDQDIYSVALVLQTGKKQYYYYPFDSTVSFTVVGAQVVTPLPLSQAQ